jgi:hypothetical protein
LKSNDLRLGPQAGGGSAKTLFLILEIATNNRKVHWNQQLLKHLASRQGIFFPHGRLKGIVQRILRGVDTKLK